MANERPTHARARMPTIDRMETLEEISQWLGTYAERLRRARAHEREQIASTLDELDRQYRRRRAELA